MTEAKKYDRFAYHITCSGLKIIGQEMSTDEIIQIIKDTYPGLATQGLIFETLEYDMELGSFKSVWTVKALNSVLLSCEQFKRHIEEKDDMIQQLTSELNKSEFECRQLKSKLADWEESFSSVSTMKDKLRDLEARGELYFLQKGELENLKKIKATMKAKISEYLHELNEKEKRKAILIEENQKPMKELA